MSCQLKIHLSVSAWAQAGLDFENFRYSSQTPETATEQSVSGTLQEIHIWLEIIIPTGFVFLTFLESLNLEYTFTQR